MKSFFPFLLLLLLSGSRLYAQDPAAVMKQIRAKLEMINDYQADASLKTEISFLKVPDAMVKIYL